MIYTLLLIRSDMLKIKPLKADETAILRIAGKLFRILENIHS